MQGGYGSTINWFPIISQEMGEKKGLKEIDMRLKNDKTRNH